MPRTLHQTSDLNPPLAFRPEDYLPRWKWCDLQAQLLALTQPQHHAIMRHMLASLREDAPSMAPSEVLADMVTALTMALESRSAPPPSPHAATGQVLTWTGDS